MLPSDTNSEVIEESRTGTIGFYEQLVDDLSSNMLVVVHDEVEPQTLKDSSSDHEPLA